MLPAPPEMPASPVDSSLSPAPVPRRAPWLRYSIGVLAGLALIAALKLAHQAVVPVLFAVFIALLLSPTVDMLARRRIPREVAAVVVMVAVVALVAACLGATWHPARDLLDTAPQTMRTLEQKVRPLTRFIAKVERVSTQAE